MYQQLTRRQRKGLAIGLLVIVVLLIIQMLIVPVISTNALYNEEIEDLQFKLNKYQHAVDNKANLEAQLQLLKEELAETQLFQSNIAPGIVAATLQNRIRQIVEKIDGNLISTQVMPEKNENTFTRVAINVRLTGNDSVLQQLLFELESSTPLLFVDKVGLSSNRRPSRAEAKSNPLNISLEASTYLYSKELK
jgi:general secretion pathway protein M